MGEQFFFAVYNLMKQVYILPSSLTAIILELILISNQYYGRIK